MAKVKTKRKLYCPYCGEYLHDCECGESAEALECPFCEQDPCICPEELDFEISESQFVRSDWEPSSEDHIDYERLIQDIAPEYYVASSLSKIVNTKDKEWTHPEVTDSFTCPKCKTTYSERDVLIQENCWRGFLECKFCSFEGWVDKNANNKKKTDSETQM